MILVVGFLFYHSHSRLWLANKVFCAFDNESVWRQRLPRSSVDQTSEIVACTHVDGNADMIRRLTFRWFRGKNELIQCKRFDSMICSIEICVRFFLLVENEKMINYYFSSSIFSSAHSKVILIYCSAHSPIASDHFLMIRLRGRSALNCAETNGIRTGHSISRSLWISLFI